MIGQQVDVFTLQGEVFAGAEDGGAGIEVAISLDDGIAFEATYLAEGQGVVLFLLIQLGFGFAIAGAGHAFGQAGGETGFFFFVVFVVLVVVVGSLDVDVTAGTEYGLVVGDDVAATYQYVLIAADVDLFAADAAAYNLF
ncbi:hypothetical protein BHC59_02095 [Snodgrassella alvi]|nr:hypothetical protein BHC59_02095 [Snodgrassella alvi]